MDDLIRVALTGTAKHAAAGVADGGHPAEALVGRLPVPDREDAFLLRSGVRSVFEQCGQVPRCDVPALTPAPAEDRRTAPERLVGLLQNVTASGSWDLLIEFLRHLDAEGLLLPPELLPQLLSLSDAAVRRHLRPIVGQRGKWLSGFNSRWQWVVEGAEALSPQDRDSLRRRWDEGSIGERCSVLDTLRRSDPEEARQWLAESLNQDKADHRARLLAVLETGLADDDQTLLESRLDDRSDQVRRVAASLLARLPRSPLAQRMRERAEAMLSAERTGLLRKRLTLVCRPPEKIDASWERDGVPRNAPKGRGNRALWTESVLSAVPPSLWSRRFDAEPAALIVAVMEDDFAADIIAGWTQAAVTFSVLDPASAAWLRPLWDHWLTVAKRGGSERVQHAVQSRLQSLLAAMPDAESAMQPLLKAAAAESGTQLLALLPMLPRPWSESLAGEYLAAVRAVLSRYADARAYPWVGSLTEAARALPRAAFDRALESLPAADAGEASRLSHAIAREIDNFRETIETRKQFYEIVKTSAGTR